MYTSWCGKVQVLHFNIGVIYREKILFAVYEGNGNKMTRAQRILYITHVRHNCDLSAPGIRNVTISFLHYSIESIQGNFSDVKWILFFKVRSEYETKGSTGGLILKLYFHYISLQQTINIRKVRANWTYQIRRGNDTVERKGTVSEGSNLNPSLHTRVMIAPYITRYV